MNVPNVVTGLRVTWLAFLCLLVGGSVAWGIEGNHVGAWPLLALAIGAYGSFFCWVYSSPSSQCHAGAMILGCAFIVLAGFFMLGGIVMAIYQSTALFAVGLGMAAFGAVLIALGTLAVEQTPQDEAHSCI